jgi:predicted transcriptional regulator
MPAPPETDRLSPLETQVMDIIWRRRQATAEEVQADLGRALNNATVRTLLRRIEQKGFLGHRLEGRAFVYYPLVAAQTAARGALRRLLRRFYAGSAEQLVQGLLDGRLIDRKQLERIAREVNTKARAKERTR